MEALYNYNIKIVEGNPFALLVPFVKRTYVSCKPIDEDINVLALEDVVAKFGGVEYSAEKTPGGVLVRIPGNLPPENYDLIITATYYGTDIRAAYKAVTIVSWNEQSNAQQYVQGSPVVLPAAFYIASLTDAELEQLKQNLREAIALTEQAREDAEQAKQEWEQKAADLDGVAQEETSQSILTAVENIDIDTSDLAKQGTDTNATNTAILSFMQDIWKKRNDWNGFKFGENFQPQSVFDLFANREKVIFITDDVWEGTVPNIGNTFVFGIFAGLQKYVLKKVTAFSNVRYQLYDGNTTGIRWIEIPRLRAIRSSYSGIPESCYVGIFDEYDGDTGLLIYSGQGHAPNLIILRIGASFTGSKNLANWIPSYSMQANSINPLNDSYSSNGERLNASLRENIAALLPNGDGALTLTFSQVLRNAMTEETEQAFINKGWNLAPARTI